VFLTQIVPRLPPPVEGVGSYAEALAGALAAGGIATRFVTAEAARTAEDLLAVLDGEENGPVLLHYANYGYHPRGCPRGLVEGLTSWSRHGAGRLLVTLFHEVWATGPPWRSSFWLAPLQRRLAAALARLSAEMVTSLDLYARMVRPWAGERPIRVMPVFSTIGEPAAVPPLAGRAPRMVVFGGRGVRSRAWGRELPALAAASRELEIEEILDVGPATTVPERVGAIPVRSLGVLTAEEAGACLLGARAGFLSYPPPFLPKSTIFAAYCAHGVAPVCAWSRPAVSAGPLPPFWRTDADPAKSAARARAWYGEHALARQAEAFREMISGETPA
jgi:hypothetical protein